MHLLEESDDYEIENGGEEEEGEEDECEEEDDEGEEEDDEGEEVSSPAATLDQSHTCMATRHVHSHPRPNHKPRIPP